MLKKPDDASSPSEDNSAQHPGFISLEKFTPLVKGAANQLMNFVHLQESVPHIKDTEVMESVIGQTGTETTAQDTDTAAEYDKSKLSESADLFKSVLNTALQEYGSQQQRLLEYIEQTDKLRNDVDRLASTLEVTEQQRQHLILQNSHTTAELDGKIEELFEAIQVTNEQRQQLEAAAHKEQALYSTIKDSEFRCQSLEVRAREADELDSKITGLNAELQFQSSKINEIQASAQALGNDNEILKQSLEEAEQYRQELEARNKQTAAEFARKIEEVTETLRTTEEQHRQLEARHNQSTTDFTLKIEELTGTLQTAEQERQQLEHQNSQSTAEFTARIAELSAALHAAEKQWQQLELQHSQSTTEFTARVEELSASLQAAEQQRQQLEAEKQQVTTELTRKVDELSGTLRTAQQQREQLEAEKHQVTTELTQKAESLSGALQAAEGQRQQLEAEKQQVTTELTQKVAELSGTLQSSETQRQALVHRASQADMLDVQVASLNSEIEALTSKLQRQEDKTSELQFSLNSFHNDNEIIKLSLAEKDALIEDLETEKHRVTTELTQKVDKLTSALQATEDLRQRLEAKKHQVTAELTHKAEELSGALQTSEYQRQQLEAEKQQVTAELTHKTEELSGALQAAETERTQLVAEKNQISGELAHKTEELSGALQTSEEQRQALVHRASQADMLDAQVVSLNSEIEALTTKLQLQEDNTSELQFSLNSSHNDNEIIKLSLAEKDALIEDLETGKHQVTTDFTRKVEELTGALQASENQHARISQEYADLTHKVDGLSGALRAAEEQRQQLTERANQVEQLQEQSTELAGEAERLKAALQESIGQRQSLEDRARQADKLAAENSGLNDEIERLNSELRSQASRANELQLRSNGFTNDNEMLKLSLEDKDKLLQQLDSQASAAQAALARETEELATALQSAEKQILQLQTEKHQTTSELTDRIEELSGTLHAAEEQRQQLAERASQADQLNNQSGELQHEVERLAAALQAAEQQRETLELRASQADELSTRVEELSAALHQSEQQRQQLGEHASQAELNKNQSSELLQEIERLTAALQAAEHQREALEQRVSQTDELSNRVEQLSDALHASEEQRQQLVEHSAQAEALNNQTIELKTEVEQLTTALQLAKTHASVSVDEADNNTIEAPAAWQESVPEDTDSFLEAIATNEFSAPPADSEAGIHVPEKFTGDPQEQDPLTGLPNRQGFQRGLEEGIKEFPATEQEQAVLYIVLDNLTSISETAGVAASDGVVVEVARLITENFKTPDTIARFGDGVFTILHHNASVTGIQEQAEILLHAIEDQVIETNDLPVMTTASIGICVINDYTTDPQNILNRADLACEFARSSGGNQLQIHSTIIDEQLSHENMDEWGELIRKTLEDERFYLVYQPVICLGDDMHKRYEVLLRIVDEDGKIVLPGKFMSLAENLGLSREIDLWVIDSALKKLAESNDSNNIFFIKLSVAALQDAGLPRWIQDKLTAYSLGSASVVFEIPEEVAINNLKHTMLFTKAMSTLGCKVALEHYAAVTQPQLLKHIQTDYLKIDGPLISSLGTTKQSHTAVRAIVDRSRQYDLKCVAEHVDSAASLAMLWELGIDFAQGNFIQEPSKEIDYDFFGEIETHEIPQAPDYTRTAAPQKEPV